MIGRQNEICIVGLLQKRPASGLANQANSPDERDRTTSLGKNERKKRRKKTRLRVIPRSLVCRTKGGSTRESSAQGKGGKIRGLRIKQGVRRRENRCEGNSGVEEGEGNVSLPKKRESESSGGKTVGKGESSIDTKKCVELQGLRESDCKKRLWANRYRQEGEGGKKRKGTTILN